MANQFNHRPSMDEVIEMHRKKREKEREARRKNLTPEEIRALEEEEESFVPAGSPSLRSNAELYLQKKERERLGLPEETEDSDPITQEEKDFMAGKQASIKATPTTEPLDLEEKFRAWQDKQNQGEEEDTDFKSAPMPQLTRRERADTSDLEDQLSQAEELYRNAQSQIDKREAIEAFFNGLGRIGAGLAGHATGTDMSGVKFDKQDWEKKRDRALSEFDSRRKDVRDQTRDREQQHQFDVRADQTDTQILEQGRARRADEKHRSEVLAENIRHNMVMEQIGFGKMNAALAKAAASSNSKLVEQVQKNSEETDQRIKAILSNNELSEEQKIEQMAFVVRERTGLSPEKAKYLVSEQGWFSDEKDPEQIYRDLNTLFYFQAFKNDLIKQAPEGRTIIYRTGKDGAEEWNTVANEDVNRLEPGWIVLN